MLAKARRDYLNNPAMEKEALAASNGRATRRGATLLLQRAGHKPVQRSDNKPACDDEGSRFDAAQCTRFTLVADLPARNAYLVARSGYEGCADLLLIDDRSGRETVFADVPVFSPDGQRLLIQNECEADGSASDNHLEIWRRQNGGWVLEWRYTDAEAYAADPTLKRLFRSNVVAWQGDHIVLTFINTETAQHWTGTLDRQSGRWILAAGPLHSP